MATKQIFDDEQCGRVEFFDRLEHDHAKKCLRGHISLLFLERGSRQTVSYPKLRQRIADDINLKANQRGEEDVTSKRSNTGTARTRLR